MRICLEPLAHLPKGLDAAAELAVDSIKINQRGCTVVRVAVIIEGRLLCTVVLRSCGFIVVIWGIGIIVVDSLLIGVQ